MPEPWRSSAFGLALGGDEVAPGLPARPAGRTARRTTLRATTAAEIDASWPAGRAQRLSTEHEEPGAPARTIDFDEEHGWRLAAPGWGLARVARDGSVVDCAREGAETWRWERFLVGRALPFAAVAAGLEAVHAAAVATPAGVLALTGPSGAGKSSIAAALALRGASLLTDDVLVLEPMDGGVIAHPGPDTLALRDGEAASLGARVGELGVPRGAGGGKTYVGTAGHQKPAPLARIALLHRTDEPTGVAVAAAATPPARVVLGMFFVPELSTPERLLAQLAMADRLAQDVAFHEVCFGTRATAGHVAEALLA